MQQRALTPKTVRESALCLCNARAIRMRPKCDEGCNNGRVALASDICKWSRITQYGSALIALYNLAKRLGRPFVRRRDSFAFRIWYRLVTRYQRRSLVDYIAPLKPNGSFDSAAISLWNPASPRPEVTRCLENIMQKYVFGNGTRCLRYPRHCETMRLAV
jgi:hypothetical protein